MRLRLICQKKEQADVDLPILYEDDDVIVVNKPSGLLTHAKGGLSDEPTVAEIIRPKTSFATDTDRPGIVHRLDRDTSGLLIIAKNPESCRASTEAICRANRQENLHSDNRRQAKVECRKN